MWDPGQYQRFGDERSRPFFDLVGRVAAEAPRVVVDLGCGPGTLTAALARRWPHAKVHGIDSSAEMIEAAQALRAGSSERLSFALGDVRGWKPEGGVDVIVSNAVLQWVPGHLGVLARWAGFLQPGGWLAFQIPANHDQQAHSLLHEQAGSPPWQPRLGDVLFSRQTGDPGYYLELLTRYGCAVDAWETTYMQVLSGENPVLEWFKGTALRPVLAALGEEARADFLAEFGPKLLSAYPPASYGTLFRFRRVFVVVQK